MHLVQELNGGTVVVSGNALNHTAIRASSRVVDIHIASLTTYNHTTPFIIEVEDP